MIARDIPATRADASRSRSAHGLAARCLHRRAHRRGGNGVRRLAASIPFRLAFLAGAFLVIDDARAAEAQSCLIGSNQL